WYPQGYCRFQPHCSEYAILAFQQHGLIKGLWLSLKRLARCHPWQQPKIDYPQ
ncbi:MAG: membrane protein insertion efficiency factor YidD, partial [Candidatus Komeilibacteria bacterium]|nr:membrane protein insertion efficiency factor YidD [Candidatus Komeilibacteria bacterium]